MRQHFLGMVAVIALSSGALAGCAGPDPAPDPSGFHAPAHSVVLGEYTAHASPKNHTFTITRIGDGAQYGPAIQAQSLTSLTIVNDGNPDSNPADTVELDTTSYTDQYPAEDTATGVVVLAHFFTRSFANVFVQVTSVTDDSGNTLTGHSGINSYSGDSFGLDASLGLWQYTADGTCSTIGESGCNASTTPGVLAQAPNNEGTQTWIFANPDDADANYDFAVYASEDWPDYTFGFGNLGYMDACSGGTSTAGTNKTGIALPFDFTLYSVNSSTVSIARNGQITLGGTLTASGTSIALPSTSAPHPVIFAFWDNLVVGTGGKMCWQTIGTAPNRQFVVEWRGMNFGNAPGNSPASSLDFEAYLYEGTGEIDTVYNTMNDPSDLTGTGRDTGTQATVGIQDGTGTISTSEHDDNLGDSYGSGNAYSYVPNAL
jgi:hypothetical protein